MYSRLVAQSTFAGICLLTLVRTSRICREISEYFGGKCITRGPNPAKECAIGTMVRAFPGALRQESLSDFH